MLTADDAGRARDLLSAGRRGLRPLLPRPGRRAQARATRSSTPITPISRPSRRRGSTMPSGSRRWRPSASASGRTSLVVEIASQRRLPAAIFRARAAFRCSASSRPPTPPRSAIAQGHPDDRRFLRRDACARSWRASGAGRSDRRQQRLRPCARHQRLRRRACKLLLKPGGVVYARVSAPAAADRARTSSTRSTTSISPISRCGVDRAHLRRAGLDGLRRRGAADPRRIAARLCRPCRRRRPSRARASVDALLAEEERAGLRGRDVYEELPAADRRASATTSCASCSSSGRPAKRSPATAPRPRAIRCSTTAGSRAMS